MATEAIRTLINRVFAIIFFASMAAAIAANQTDKAIHYVWLFLIVALFGTVVGAIGDLVGQYYENVVYGELQMAYYKKLTNKDMAFYRDNHTGYLTVMLRQYVDSSLLLVRLFKGEFIRILISLTVPAVVLLSFSLEIGLVAVVIIVSQLGYMFWASSKTKKHRAITHEIYRKISGEVADDVTNIVAYKASGQEEAAQTRLKKLRVHEMAAYWERRKIGVLLDFPRNVLTIILASLIFWIIIDSATNKEASVKLLVLTITYIFQINRNLNDLPDAISNHDDLIDKLGPTLETLSGSYENIKDPHVPKPLNITHASIDIKAINFKYLENQSDKYIFKDFSLNISAGEHVGIVGLSGAGKSTLASLLMRFDELDSGKILIDGINIQDVSQAELHRKIAYVPQEPVLFHRSIKENIAYHNHKAKTEDIKQAAIAAHAHGFITKLPKGYDTIVGERGVKLSGGQKQRIVIARAVLKNAPIILFDEATSALDSESEHIIQQALPKIIGNHTAIIIAHRLSTVARLDRIIVIHDGQIEEQGTHQQLIQNRGRYYSLWQRQTSNKI
jgi:ATP-binding cassette subfamily B protein